MFPGSPATLILGHLRKKYKLFNFYCSDWPPLFFDFQNNNPDAAASLLHFDSYGL